MLLLDDKKGEHPTQADDNDFPGLGTVAGPSSLIDAPPTMEESVRDRILNVDFSDTDVFVPPGGEEDPPQFTPYEAEYFQTSDGKIVSHDDHLNEDGEALYRFLLSHSQSPPTFQLHLHGSHVEHHTRRVHSTDSQGRSEWRTESDDVTVLDFDFYIDISQHIASGPLHWTVPDEQPAYRGQMYTEVDGPPVGEVLGHIDMEVAAQRGSRRKVTRQETKRAEAWAHERQARGLPPWVGPGTDNALRPGNTVHPTDVLRSSKTVRQWADEYCASPKMLKEFTYEKVVYGWNFAAVQAAVTAAVQSTYYNGKLTVKFQCRSNQVHIRANNWLSRMLSNKWIKFFLWITLLYPFIWMFKRFAAEGGGRWEVCGGAYPLKSWHFVSPGDHQGSVVQTNQGAAELVGMKEGEWFQNWEGTIKRAVNGRLKSSIPLTQSDVQPTSAALMLDGYRAS